MANYFVRCKEEIKMSQKENDSNYQNQQNYDNQPKKKENRS